MSSKKRKRESDKKKNGLKSDVNEYYKSINDIGSILLKKYKDVKVVENQNDDTISIINNENDEILLTCTYWYIGAYDIDRELWLWSYNNFALNTNSTKFKKYIDDFILEIKKNIKKYDKIEHEYIETVYNYLNNEIIYIQYKYILDLLKVMIYLLKCNGIMPYFNPVNGINKMDFYIIRDITLNNI
jgi:hypothetical protein